MPVPDGGWGRAEATETLLTRRSAASAVDYLMTPIGTSWSQSGSSRATVGYG